MSGQLGRRSGFLEKNISLIIMTILPESLASEQDSNSPQIDEWIQREVVEGSGVAPSLAEVATKVLPDLIIQNGEVIETPIHNALNWERYTRFGQQATPSIEGLFFYQESGEVFQVKLSEPRKDANGKDIKYETAIGNGSKPCLSPVDADTRRKIAVRNQLTATTEGAIVPSGKAGIPLEGSFWEWVKQSSVSVIITEGAKKSLSLLSEGFVAIALNGVNGGYRSKDEMGRLLPDPELIPELKDFNWEGRTVVIAFDAESEEKKQSRVGAAVNRFAALLNKEGARTYAASWKASEGKGIDDLKVNRGVGRVIEVISRARPIKQKKLTKMQMAMMVARSLGVKLNELTWQVEIDGKTVKLSELWCTVCESSGIEISKDYFVDACLAVAAENSYHPIERYLEGLNSVVIADPRQYLADFFCKYFGLDPVREKLQVELCIKWAIGAVKRIYEPGCFLKNMLILQGGQNAGKSSFFRSLAGEKYFGDPEQTGNAKDDAIIPHMCWLVEMSELETVYKRKDVSQLKAHLSRPFDMLRRPYAREFEKIDRRYSIVGTTNKSTFLYDSTGSVRFWVVEIKPGFKIPFNEIHGKVRDEFWAAVRMLYKAGETTEPTDEQWEQLSQANKKFEATQDFESYVLSYVEGRDKVSTKAIREHLQKTMPAGDRIPSGIAIKEFLESLGWQYSSKLVSDDYGNRVRMLTAPLVQDQPFAELEPEPEPDPDPTPAPASIQQVESQPNPGWKVGDRAEVLAPTGEWQNGWSVAEVIPDPGILKIQQQGSAATQTIGWNHPNIRQCRSPHPDPTTTQSSQPINFLFWAHSMVNKHDRIMVLEVRGVGDNTQYIYVRKPGDAPKSAIAKYWIAER